MINSSRTLDCYGLMCPMPIVKTAQEVKKMEIGQILEILSTDVGIKEDMPAWCRQTGQEFLGIEKEGDIIKVYVKKIVN